MNILEMHFESLFFSYNAFNTRVEMIANINATNHLKKTKRLTPIFNSTIFIDDKNEFEH